MPLLSGIVVHDEPLRREHSNFVIRIELPDDGTAAESEQLWARQAGERLYELCCVPFYTYGLAVGDIVETDEDFWVVKVATRSQHQTYRVWFGESHARQDLIITELGRLGAEMERFSAHMFAVDAPDAVIAGRVESILNAAQQDAKLQFERG